MQPFQKASPILCTRHMTEAVEIFYYAPEFRVDLSIIDRSSDLNGFCSIHIIQILVIRKNYSTANMVSLFVAVFIIK